MSEQRITRAAIYIRVSTAEQAMHGKSLLAQREYLEDYAQKHGMKVVGVYADEGQTARKELRKRKAIHALLGAVERNEIDVILFWKMDRWFRSVSDFYKVQDVLDKYNTKWIAVAEPNMNMETRDGRLNLNIMLSIGQNEVDTTSERIKFTVDSMIQNGRVVWGDANLPLGYKIAIVDGVKKMVKDPETEHMVREFFDYFRKYGAKRKTVIYMQETFHTDFSYAMLRTMLSSEFYIGKYRNNLNYCPAYLTAAEWKEIQKISSRNVHTNRSGRVYLFSGLIRCPVCGQKLSGTGCSSIINRHTGEKRTYCYYRCNRALVDHICTYRHRMSQNLIEEYLLKNLEREYELFKVRISTVSEKQKQKKNKRTPKQINAERERLNLMFQKNRISFDYYDAEYAKLDKELAELDTIVGIVRKDYSYLESILQNDFGGMYSSLSIENRQAFWRRIIERIHISEDNSIKYVDFL